MIAEIIIIGVLAAIAPIAGAAAIHNIKELSELRELRNKTELDNIALSERVDYLEYQNHELEGLLKIERINSKMLERALLDSVTEQVEPEPEENQLNELESGDNDEILQANAKERLPKLPTNFYPAEYMTTITNERSEQYKLQQKCHTEIGTGLRYYYDGAEEYYTVAMGGAYGDTIGDAWRVTLECGSVFNIMRGDFKHALPAEPDDFGDICRNYDKQLCMCVLEFITDKSAMPQYLKEAGGFHELEFFGGKRGTGGNIVKMEYLGRRWEP